MARRKKAPCWGFSASKMSHRIRIGNQVASALAAGPTGGSAALERLALDVLRPWAAAAGPHFARGRLACAAQWGGGVEQIESDKKAARGPVAIGFFSTGPHSLTFDSSHFCPKSY